jgi:hypothetical protein
MGKHKSTFSKSALLSLGWTVITVLAEVIVYVSLIVEGLVEPEVMSGSLGFFTFGIVNATCCFFIVRQKPVSIWFVPVIINAFLLVMAFFNTAFWMDPWWAPVASGWILCLMASITGILIRKKMSVSQHQFERV